MYIFYTSTHLNCIFYGTIVQYSFHRAFQMYITCHLIIRFSML